MREERAEPTGIHLQQPERAASIASLLWGSPQPCRALPSGRAERDRGRRRADAPRRPSARPEPPDFGHPAAKLPSRGTAASPALSAPGTGHHRSPPGQPVQPLLGAPALTPKRRRSPRRGLRCPAVASPRPAAAVGAYPRPAEGRGGSAWAARAPGGSSLGAPAVLTASAGHLWGPAARGWCPAQCHPAAAG